VIKKLLFFLLLSLPILTYSVDPTCCSKKSGKKCTGSASCTACTNCSGCKYCNAGGTCGVCSSGKPAPVKAKAQSTQCQAITKKGTQCSRAARSGGYCWQHGG
jgi:hypothetical protein